MAPKFNLNDLLSQRSKEQQLAAVENNPGQVAPEKNNIEMIDIYDLVPSKDNFYNVDDQLKENIAIFGVLQPLLVKPLDDGKYQVIAGHRRRLAVLALVKEGREERRSVPCVFKADCIHDKLALIMANKFREKSDWEKMQEAVESEELAKEIKTEYQIKGKTREILAELLDVTESQLARYKAVYNNLIPQLMEKFKLGTINISTAVELAGMEEEWQQKALINLNEKDSLTIADVKELKYQYEKGKQILSQTEPNKIPYKNIGTEEIQEKQKNENEYIEPQPECIIPLCYSCTNYETCHNKKSTVTNCNAYNNRKEKYKTDEQRYNEEQDAIDKESARKLKEQQKKERMNDLSRDNDEQRIHDLKIARSKYEEIISGKLTFLLVMKDGYRIGEEVELPEYAEGSATERKVKVRVEYIWQDWEGLDDDYCILGFVVIKND